MTFAVPFLALAVGALLAVFLGLPSLPPDVANYIALACLAGFDTILGGVRGGLEDRFEGGVFVSGFFVNIAIAFLLAFLGDRIGVNLYLVVAFVFGNRIFTNLSLIRRMGVTRLTDWSKRRERQAATLASTTETPS